MNRKECNCKEASKDVHLSCCPCWGTHSNVEKSLFAVSSKTDTSRCVGLLCPPLSLVALTANPYTTCSAYNSHSSQLFIYDYIRTVGIITTIRAYQHPVLASLPASVRKYGTSLGLCVEIRYRQRWQAYG